MSGNLTGVIFTCSVFTMSELLSALEEAGKIDKDVVRTVSHFIEQNQLHSAMVNNPSTVSAAVIIVPLWSTDCIIAGSLVTLLPTACA